MSSANRVIAILCSDIHLSHKPSLARSVEPDWYAAMDRQLKQLAELAEKHQACIIVAGDIFDRWNSPPELINFAMDHLPRCNIYTIAGQHDLPYHNIADIRKSAYWTLVAAGRIIHGNAPFIIDNWTFYPFSWAEKITPPPHGDDNAAAIIHGYIWKGKHSYPGAPVEYHFLEWHKRLTGYRLAVFGDNHQGFTHTTANQQIINCGTFFRRRIDEKNYKPAVYLLYRDGSLSRQYLDCSQDRFLDAEEPELQQLAIYKELEKVSNGLIEAGGLVVDYAEAIRRVIRELKVDDQIQKILLKALEQP